MNRERKSPRLKNWDYTNNGLYFITICTKDRKHYFGQIKSGELVLSPCGAIANVLWAELEHRNKNLSLGEFVVMPNHVHGIIQLENPPTGDACNRTDLACNRTDVACNVPIRDEWMAAISPKSNSISAIIRSYKSAVTKHCNRLKLNFAWQSRYHDHIIRDDKSFQRISDYIIKNPQNWKEDGFYF